MKDIIAVRVDLAVDSHKVVVRRKNMDPHDVEEIFKLDILVCGTNIVWKRPVKVSRHIMVTPQFCVSATEADDRLRFETFECPHIRADELGHYTGRFTPV